MKYICAMTSPGYGWTLSAFDASSRTGCVVNSWLELPFDSDAAADEDLRVGDEVFVRLLPPSERPHVARVWPCVARLAVSSELVRAGAPELSDAIAREARTMIAKLSVPVQLHPITRTDGSLALLAASADMNAYGIGGWDIAVQGAMVCEGARAIERTATITAASARLASNEERAFAHAASAIGPTDVVVTLAEARAEFTPEDHAAVVLVTCARVSWEPGPSSARTAAAERALVDLVGRPWDVSRFFVEDGSLVVTHGGRSERFFELSGAEDCAAFGVWCEAVNAVLDAARDEDV